MPLKVRLPDGTDVEGTPQELVDFLRLRSTNNGRNMHAHYSLYVPRETAGENADEEFPEKARRLISVLIKADDGMETAKLAGALNISVKAVGGFVTSLTNWSRKNGLGGKKDLLLKRRIRLDGAYVRTLMLTKKFRQLVKEGRIPGF